MIYRMLMFYTEIAVIISVAARTNASENVVYAPATNNAMKETKTPYSTAVAPSSHVIKFIVILVRSAKYTLRTQRLQITLFALQ
jgi:hypothetical protein